MITLKIDVTKLDESRFFTGKVNPRTGKAPVYCDLVLIELREPSQYGDTHMVKQASTKEERQNGVQLPIVGNGKEIKARTNAAAKTPQAENQITGNDDDVPF